MLKVEQPVQPQLHSPRTRNESYRLWPSGSESEQFGVSRTALSQDDPATHGHPYHMDGTSMLQVRPARLSIACDMQPGQPLVSPDDDNLLRRKTPNGTIIGGYQSSLGQSYYHRQFVGTLPTPFSQTSFSPFSPPFIPFSHEAAGYQSSIGLPQYVNPLAQGQSTVVQLPNQPNGPTASGLDHGGLYGPYWHDGTFVPYRPHAIRDPRYYSHAAQSYQRLPAITLSPHYAPLYPRSPHNSTPVRPPMQARHSVPHVTHSQVSQSSTPLEESHYRASFSPSPIAPLPFADVLRFEDGRVTLHDRERIFNLALRTYRDLLSFLENAKRTSPHPQHGQSNGRPSIYPKAPSPSLLGLRQWERNRGPAATQANLSDREDSRPRSKPDIGDHNSTSTALPTGLGSQGVARQPTHVMHGSAAQHQTRNDQTLAANDHGYQDNKRLRSNSEALSTATRHALQNTAFIRAHNALSTLSKLCHIFGGQWVDGLNLCGCLAYGLGDYNQALAYYSKVLQCDPKHVEASSNMAAALLALHRRHEAEQHWANVVKQAPSYFEAVEHLVGLLCASGRGKDAVGVIDHVERALHLPGQHNGTMDAASDASSLGSHASSVSDCSDRLVHEYDVDSTSSRRDSGTVEPGFGSSGYAIPGSDNGRMLALVHAKGNMMYSQGDNAGAAKAFENVVLIASARKYKSIKAVVQHVLDVISAFPPDGISPGSPLQQQRKHPILLHPDQAAHVAKLCFPPNGNLPGLAWLPADRAAFARRGATLMTSNSLLSLAKVYQDGMSGSNSSAVTSPLVSGVREILALYYLSLSIQPSPSTANNIGILLAGIQQSGPLRASTRKPSALEAKVPGMVPGSGLALALAYYNYGLILDSRHAHLYTNLGSLLKDIGQLDAAIDMYKRAVSCDDKFDIALANLANAVKDKGRIGEAIEYYHRSVEVNPDFAEAVCGLAHALNSVCRWKCRGGIVDTKMDRWHVDDQGMLLDSSSAGVRSSGWMKRVVDIVDKQLRDGEDWGIGSLTPGLIEVLVRCSLYSEDAVNNLALAQSIMSVLRAWAGRKYEGARLVRLVERLMRRTSWRWYRDRHVRGEEQHLTSYCRPQLPPTLSIPPAPTVLPFHTFTTPMSAKQVRLISQRNSYRISASTLKMPWLPATVYQPPATPSPALKVGYLSSDFNNHPLAHLMQSVFGLHDRNRVECYCYATTASDNSVHRQQIEQEAPHFHDCSSWSFERMVNQIVADGIHILVNLNGYTRGARNEVFAARPAPINMTFMGFAGTLGAEWNDYVLADETAVPPATLRPWRRNINVMDLLADDNCGTEAPSPQSGPSEETDWVYGENLIYSRSTFFCCDHRQSAPDAKASPRPTWEDEQSIRWRMRKELFPDLAPNTVIFANFNQLYKIEPTTYRTWLRILSRVPNAVLWLLRFPDVGEASLKRTAQLWAGPEVARRVIFTDVAPKHQHISRAKVADLCLDTPECNAHTTAADVLWSGTPLLTYPRHMHKMCSRMAASILKGALPREPKRERERIEKELIATSDDDYEEKAIALAQGLSYPDDSAVDSATSSNDTMAPGRGIGRLFELRRMLTEARWTSDLFDTKRWVSDLEDAYEEAWRKWVAGEGGDIWLDQVPRGRTVPLP